MGQEGFLALAVVLVVLSTNCIGALTARVVVGRIDDTRPHNPWNTVDDYSQWERETSLSEGDVASKRQTCRGQEEAGTWH